ncbi:membrane protein required for colicin V production [Acidiphilium sp. MT5]
MTWADGIAVAIVLLSGLLALARGFVREILGVFAWVTSGLVALSAYGAFEPFVLHYVSNPKLALPLTIAAVFLVVLIILTIIVSFIASLVRDSVLSGLDRTLGLVFGLVRGAAIVCLLLIFVSIFLQPAEWPAAVINAEFLPATETGASLLISVLPARFRPVLGHPLPSDAGQPKTGKANADKAKAGQSTAPEQPAGHSSSAPAGAASSGAI